VAEEGAWQIAARARGTPRIANRLLRRVRDYVEVRAEGAITAALAAEGLEMFGVDGLGLDKVDRAILDALCRRFEGRPVGLVTLAQCIGEETETVEDAYEPYLLQQDWSCAPRADGWPRPGPSSTWGCPIPGPTRPRDRHLVVNRDHFCWLERENRRRCPGQEACLG